MIVWYTFQKVIVYDLGGEQEWKKGDLLVQVKDNDGLDCHTIVAVKWNEWIWDALKEEFTGLADWLQVREEEKSTFFFSLSNWVIGDTSKRKDGSLGGLIRYFFFPVVEVYQPPRLFS